MKLVKFVVLVAAWAYCGSFLSTIHPEACDQGELACGTAWWLLGSIAFVAGYSVWAFKRLGKRASRRNDDASEL